MAKLLILRKFLATFAMFFLHCGEKNTQGLRKRYLGKFSANFCMFLVELDLRYLGRENYLNKHIFCVFMVGVKRKIVPKKKTNISHEFSHGGILNGIAHPFFSTWTWENIPSNHSPSSEIASNGVYSTHKEHS